MPEGVRVIIEVTAGVIPGTAEEDRTRRWSIASSLWEAAANGDQAAANVITDIQGAAMNYALMQQNANRNNWCRLDWIYL